MIRDAMDPVDEAGSVLEKYGPDADKPSVRLAKAVIALHEECERLRGEYNAAWLYLDLHDARDAGSLGARLQKLIADRDALHEECEKHRAAAGEYWRKEPNR